MTRGPAVLVETKSEDCERRYDKGGEKKWM